MRRKMADADADDVSSALRMPDTAVPERNRASIGHVPISRSLSR